MALTSSQFSFCKKIGLMKENISREDSLNLIKQSFLNNSDVDPEFKKKVEALTLKDFTYVVAPIYHYDVDLNYTINRKTYKTHIQDLGYYHVHKELEITNYYGDGDYKTVTDLDALKLGVYHNDCVFTMQEMKKALTDTIDKKLPNGYSSFESNSWEVNAFLVPCMYAWIKLNGKEYNIVANLHNKKIYTKAYAKWEAPYKRGKTARKLNVLITAVSGLVPLLGCILVIANGKWAGIAPGLVGLALSIIGAIKMKDVSDSKAAKKFKKDPMPKLVVGLIPSFIVGGIAFILGLIAIIIANIK